MILTTLSHSGVEGFLAPLTERLSQEDYVALILNYQEGFVFNEREASRLAGKRFVVFDFGEYGVNHSWNNQYLPGITIQHHRQTCDLAERLKLDEYLKQQKIICCFKREFSQACQDLIDNGKVHYPVCPVEIFFDNIPPIEPISKDEYMSRVGLIFHLFGNSHPDRKVLAGAIMAHFERICTSLGKMADLINARLPFHLVEQIECISRYDIGTVLHHQSKCLLSVNLSGFGQKNFRNREACHNAVPIIADIGMRYAIQPDNSNAVMLPTQDGRLNIPASIAILEEVLRDRENLWERFQNAHNVAHALHPDNYVRDQINNRIHQHL